MQWDVLQINNNLIEKWFLWNINKNCVRYGIDLEQLLKVIASMIGIRHFTFRFESFLPDDVILISRSKSLIFWDL